MAPQTLHLQAVAGRAAASRRPRAQAVIYAGPCICLSRAERNRRETALPFTSQPESRTVRLTKSDAVSEIQRHIKATAGWDNTPVMQSAHVPARSMEKLSWKVASEIMPRCVRVSVRLSASMHACMCVLSGGLKFAYGRAVEERVSSWLVID